MCFICYHNRIVCTICNAAPTLFFRLGKFLMRILAFPLRPRYIRCSTLITTDIIQFNWFKTTCLLPNLLRSLSNFHWSCWSYLRVTLSGKVPYFHSNFHVVTPRTAGCCGLCFPATSVSGTVTCIQALWYAVWCMGGWLVLGLQAIKPLIQWTQLTHEFIYQMNLFIIENQLGIFLRSKCDWRCSYFDKILAIYPQLIFWLELQFYVSKIPIWTSTMNMTGFLAHSLWV